MFSNTLNFGFSEEINNLRSTVHKFAQTEILPLARETDEKNDFPHSLWKKFGNLGLLA